MTKEKPFILHALSPTKIVSPFDINMAYDSGFDNVATYTNITMEDVPDLVQDIIFSRHPNDCKKTGLFIAGEDAEEAIEMLEKAKQMQKKLVKRFSSCKNLEFIICSVKNSGADIQFK